MILAVDVAAGVLARGRHTLLAVQQPQALARCVARGRLLATARLAQSVLHEYVYHLEGSESAGVRLTTITDLTRHKCSHAAVPFHPRPDPDSMITYIAVTKQGLTLGLPPHEGAAPRPPEHRLAVAGCDAAD